MFKLYSVFSDHALYQCSSYLTLRGIADAELSLTAEIHNGETVAASGTTVSSDNGTFSLTLPTPPGSFDTYTITVTGGGDTVTLRDIKFGELWIATGQSNMEMANYHQPECKNMLEAVKNMDIRVYCAEYHKKDADQNIFSMSPEYDMPGMWVVSDNGEIIGTSALATAFCKGLTEYFAETGKTMPVGFLNVSWGGTPIHGWIPLDILEKDERAMQLFEKQGRLPFAEKFNTYAGVNFQQPGVMYNRKIAPVLGLKARGVLWYQGENECGIEWNERIYAHFLHMLYDNFADVFAADKASFPMLSSLIYPWVYGNNGETMRGYVNQAFIETAKAEPEKFIICPIDDLPPVWAANLDNHPIHPAHKYRIGARMADLALKNVYGKNGQRAPATLDAYEICGNRILLHFADVGEGLFIRNGHIDGLFIAGDNGHYMPADCEILSTDTLAVFHPYLDAPVHCAYDISSFAVGANLWAGDYPAAPFSTAIKEPGMLHMEALSFLNPDISRVWETHQDANGRLDVYYHPVWKPLSDSEVCQDDAFADTLSGYLHSVRIAGQKNPIGAYVTSTDYHKINLSYYRAMELDLYHRADINGALWIDYTENGTAKQSVKRQMTAVEGAEYTFKRYTVDLSELPEGEIETLRFVFECSDTRDLPFVNIVKLVLR